MDDIADKKAYELAFLAKTEDGAETVLKLLKGSGAGIDLEGQVVKMPLAYPVEKEREAYFCYFHFSLEPGKLSEVETHLRVQPGILRFLVVTPPFMKNKPRAFFPQRRRAAPVASSGIERRPSSLPLSNEALEKQLKEMQ